jgi:hypothetical protein
MVSIDSDLRRARILYGIAQQHNINVTEIQQSVTPEGIDDWFQLAHITGMEERSGESFVVDPRVYNAMVSFSILVSQELSRIGINVL